MTAQRQFPFSQTTMSTPRPGAAAAPERSLNRQVILDEDEYTEALSHIVARDFFPSLVHLDATNEYLDALHTQDPHLINASVRRLQEISSTPTPRRGWGSGPLQTPSQTPYGVGPSETPLRTPRGEPSVKRARYDTNMSLDNFQAKYTSEDNSSFTEILDDENRKRKERWAWAWDAQKRVEQQRNKMVEGRERRLIEAPPATGVREKFLIEAPAAGLITDGKETETLGETSGESVSERGKEIAIVNEAKDPDVDVMAPKKDTRTAGVDGWEFKVRSHIVILFPEHNTYSIFRPGTLSCSHQMPMSLLTRHLAQLLLTEHAENQKSLNMATHVCPNKTNPQTPAAYPHLQALLKVE